MAEEFKPKETSTDTSQYETSPISVLRGHTGEINSVALFSDGRRAISGSDDNTLRVWDLHTGECQATLEGHTSYVLSVALSSDGLKAISGSADETLRVWDLQTGECQATLEGHTSSVWSVALSSDGGRAISGSNDNTLRVWDLQTGECQATLQGHTDWVQSVALSSDGGRAISGSDDNTLRVWDLQTGECQATLEGHTSYVFSVALSSDGGRAISGSFDNTLRVWDLQTGECQATLEGHTDSVLSVALSSDGGRAVSGSEDNTLRVWDLQTGECQATLQGHTGYVLSVALSLDGRRAISGSDDATLRVWDLTSLSTYSPDGEAKLRYTNAKVLLVGDSGVGKTGLALRLAENRFEATVSTDAAWASQISLPHDTQGDGIEREIWLWDFAGQSDYRLIHQLYMDETALAIFVFNPQQDNPFEGLAQWSRALHQASRRSFHKILVAARCDRGGLRVSNEIVEQFRQEHGFAAYLPTSALSGAGCEELYKAVVAHIDWETIPWTSSPRIFKILKHQIIRLKDEGKALLRMGELKQQLEMRLPGETFTSEELRAVVGLLAGPGIVWHLEFGEFVLLQPERINAYAAAAIRKVRTHIDELGCITEEALIQGDLDYQDMKRLPKAEEEIVLRAMHQTFVERGLCLREPTEHGVLLVFPSYFKRERPEQKEHPAIYVTYRFQGDLEEIYATLVVRLTHTALLDKKVQLWHFAADFQTPAGKRVGLKMVRKNEGAGQLAVYFEQGVPDDTKVTFLRYVHDYIQAKGQEMIRERHYVCPHCGTPVENQTAVRKRLERGDKDIPCGDCEKRVLLWDVIEEKFASEEFQRRARALAEKAQAMIDNESRELILVGHAFAIAGEAGQIFRPTPNSDWGLDGEIEFKNDKGEASGRRVYLQLKSGDSYLYKRQKDREEIFTIKTPRHAEYWQNQAYPVMLVIRTSDGEIRWMDVSAYLKKHGSAVKQIVFQGEPFTASSVIQLRNRVLSA